MHDMTTAATIAIKARNVTLSLGSKAARVEILRGVDLDVGQGESLAILGASGSGKSSLMAVLSGLERASGGEILVAGVDQGKLDEDGLARARRGRVGIVLQSFHLLPTMTALENVAVPMELSGVTDAFDRARAELEAVGLGHRIDHYPSQLSGGEQQRVAIARALILKPRVLLLDEPTSALDVSVQAEILNLLNDLKAGGDLTMLLVSHDADVIDHMCDRAVHMAKGHVLS